MWENSTERLKPGARQTGLTSLWSLWVLAWTRSVATLTTWLPSPTDSICGNKRHPMRSAELVEQLQWSCCSVRHEPVDGTRIPITIRTGHLEVARAISSSSVNGDRVRNRGPAVSGASSGSARVVRGDGHIAFHLGCSGQRTLCDSGQQRRHQRRGQRPAVRHSQLLSWRGLWLRRR